MVTLPFSTEFITIAARLEEQSTPEARSTCVIIPSIGETISDGIKELFSGCEDNADGEDPNTWAISRSVKPYTFPYCS